MSPVISVKGCCLGNTSRFWFCIFYRKLTTVWSSDSEQFNHKGLIFFFWLSFMSHQLCKGFMASFQLYCWMKTADAPVCILNFTFLFVSLLMDILAVCMIVRFFNQHFTDLDDFVNDYLAQQNDAVTEYNKKVEEMMESYRDLFS